MGLVKLLFSGPEVGLIRRMIDQMYSRSGPGSRRSDRTNSRRIRRGASAIEFGRDGYLRRLLQLSSAKAGHRFRSPNEDETGDASAKLDATHQVGRGLVSEVLTLRSSAKAERSYQGVDNGGGDICRVNMIRVHRRQEEPKEPKFGESRAAPLQGADSGRPSGSSQVRGMGQERRMGPGGAHLNDDYGLSMFTQNQKSLDVPYSVTSSEGRYDRTGQNKDARPKSSTCIPISLQLFPLYQLLCNS